MWWCASDYLTSRAMIGPARLGSQTGDPCRRNAPGPARLRRSRCRRRDDDDAFVRCVWSIKKPTSTVRATARMYNEGGVGSRAHPPRPAGRARPSPSPSWPNQPKRFMSSPQPQPSPQLQNSPPSSPVAKASGRPTHLLPPGASPGFNTRRPTPTPRYLCFTYALTLRFSFSNAASILAYLLLSSVSKYGCSSASVAWMRLAGSYTSIFCRRSMP